MRPLQDYNGEVLRRLTRPNVVANMARLPRERPRPASKYFKGDWRLVRLRACYESIPMHMRLWVYIFVRAGRRRARKLRACGLPARNPLPLASAL